MTRRFSDTAMVLAAGLGQRMRPLTLTKPKPLQLVGGRTMLDHALDKLVDADIKRAVVNTFYLAEQIETHLQTRTDIEIVISRESELLDTGGGIANALRHFGGLPFFALNADLPWMDGTTPSLLRMKDKWDAAKMDALLLLMKRDKARGFGADGDFMMEASPDGFGRIWRKDMRHIRPYVMISAQILKPELFANPPAKIFSNNRIWNNAEARNRLYGIEHDGSCYHIGTPEDLRMANELLESGRGWEI
ncbi:MAG: nucleotidyltransferase family protein [Alphaproteobacteria bacterium]|nr:nucleotidyltransferase family protein [Alphaproteobacteria bacterium]